MSLQWTFIATFLYVEIFLISLLLLPFISATRWQKLFRSRVLSAFRSYANLYFNVFIAILVVLFLDSIRDVRKYNVSDEKLHGDPQANPAAEISIHMKLFRAQRNFYIAGMALFLFMVLRRMVTLLSKQATLAADVEATRKQAESATATAKKLMEDQDNKRNEKEEGASEDTAKELEKTKSDLNKIIEELHCTQLDLQAMKKQATSTNTEYDRLLKEHADLQAQMEKASGSEETKKDN